MRNKFLIPIFLLIFPLVSSAFDNEKKINSTITNVTVFRTQAQVQRIAKIDLNPGVTNLIFENLSPYINQNSIEVKAGTGVTLLSVTTQNDYLKEDERPDYILHLEDSLEWINDSLSVIKANKETVTRQIDLLLANRNTGGTQTGVKSDDLEDLLDLYRRKLDSFNSELFLYNNLEKKFATIKRKVEQQLAEYNAGQKHSSYKIIVSVQADKPIRNEQIELIYLVANVGWQPFYDIRVKDVKSDISILCKAKVTQNTGEDWNNILLKLTTANPSEGGVKPEFQTNWLRFYAPPKDIVAIQSKTPNIRGSRAEGTAYYVDGARLKSAEFDKKIPTVEETAYTYNNFAPISLHKTTPFCNHFLPSLACCNPM